MAADVDLQGGASAIAIANFEDGIALVEKGLARSPAAHPAWFLLGMVAWRLGRRDSAIEALGRAVDLKPANAAYAGALQEVRRGAPVPIGVPVGDVTFVEEALENA